MKLMDKDKLNTFDFLKSISDTKEELYEHDDFKKYPAFMVNRFLSASADTLYFAYTSSSILSHLPNHLQYAFHLNGITKKRRYFQYQGKGKIKNIDNIVKYYQCSKEQAMEYLEILTDEQIEKIDDLYKKKIERK